MATQSTEVTDRWWLVAATGLAVFMAVLDMTIVNVALPRMEQSFGTRTSVTEWVVLGYLVPMVALALPSGRWLDRVGRRPALAFAAGGFGLASIAAGAASSIEWLITARVVQGSFGSVLFALVPAIATAAVRPEVRGRAMGVIGTLGPLGGLSGPAIGGYLVDTLGWPWIFYVNVPVCLIVIVIGLVHLPADQPLRWPDRYWLRESAVLAGAVAALLLGLSLGSHQPVWFALAAVSVPMVSWWLRMPESQGVRGLLRDVDMARSHLALMAFAIWISALQFIVPFYLLRELGFSATLVGFTFLALPLAQAVTGLLGGVLADRWGMRRTAVAGAAVSIAGLALLLPLDADWGPIDVGWRLALVGIGCGPFGSANLALAMSRASGAQLGTAGASTSTVRQLGFALGPALATAIWALGGYAIGGMRGAVVLAVVAGILGAAALSRTPRSQSR